VNELLIVTIVCILGIVLSGLSSGAETGAYTLNRTRHRLKLANKEPGARLLDHLTKDMAGFVVVCLIGSNLGHALVSYATTLALKDVVHNPDLIATLVMAPVVFILAEVAPKELYRRHTSWLLYASAPPLTVLAWVFSPATRCLRGLTAVLRWVGLETDEGEDRLQAQERVRREIAAGREDGTLTAYQATLARNIFSLDARHVLQAMVPIADTDCLEASCELEEARALATRTGRTRYPVFRDRRENVIGVVDVYDLLFEERPGLTIRNFIQPHLTASPLDKVPETLLRLRKARTNLAVVVRDDQAVGIVTLKDLVEEITGELQDL
jgi:magnesium and cobalt exporter, CNNM family